MEPDYLLDSKAFYFQTCLYPMKYLHSRSMYNLPHEGVQRGLPPLHGPGALRASGGLGVKPPKEKLPCKCIL